MKNTQLTLTVHQHQINRALLLQKYQRLTTTTTAAISPSTLPLLLVHVQHRCYAALTTQAQDQLKACADDYLHSASLFSQLSMFGGSDATVAAAARDKAAAISNMHALLSSPQFQNSDLQRLLSLNAAYFLKYQAMATALHSLLVEQLQRCVRMTRKPVLLVVDCGDAVWQVHAGARRD